MFFKISKINFTFLKLDTQNKIKQNYNPVTFCYYMILVLQYDFIWNDEDIGYGLEFFYLYICYFGYQYSYLFTYLSIIYLFIYISLYILIYLSICIFFSYQSNYLYVYIISFYTKIYKYISIFVNLFLPELFCVIL